MDTPQETETIGLDSGRVVEVLWNKRKIASEIMVGKILKESWGMFLFFLDSQILNLIFIQTDLKRLVYKTSDYTVKTHTVRVSRENPKFPTFIDQGKPFITKVNLRL